MKIHVWSSPRTGSSLYSEYLGQLYNCPVIHEVFNPNYLNHYKKIINGKIIESIEYSDGCFHYVPSFDKTIITKSYNKFEDFDKRVNDWKLAYKLCTIPSVWHNHKHPCVVPITFFDKSSDDVYISRKNKAEQVASYLVALSQMSFHRVSGSIETFKIDIPNFQQNLNRILNRISLCNNHLNIPTVYYEDMDFDNITTSLVKNSETALSRISNEQAQIILNSV